MPAKEAIMHRKLFTFTLSAMFAVALVGCNDAKKPRASKKKSSATSTETAAAKTVDEKAADDKVAAKPAETDTAKGSASDIPQGEWGNLKGKFIYNGDPPKPEKIDASKDPVCTKHDLFDESLVVGDDKGLANVVVWIRTKDVKISPDYDGQKNKQAVIDNLNCRFDPHIVPYWTGQPLEVKNSDPTAHNTNVAALANAPFNEIIPAEKNSERKPLENAETTPIQVSCNIHPWMKGYMVVQPNPYVAVSGKDGSFEMKSLPTGTELEFQVWQEKSGYVQKAEIDGKDAKWAKGRFKYTIKPGDNDLGTIKLDPAQFNK